MKERADNIKYNFIVVLMIYFSRKNINMQVTSKLKTYLYGLNFGIIAIYAFFILCKMQVTSKLK